VRPEADDFRAHALRGNAGQFFHLPVARRGIVIEQKRADQGAGSERITRCSLQAWRNRLREFQYVTKMLRRWSTDIGHQVVLRNDDRSDPTERHFRKAWDRRRHRRSLGLRFGCDLGDRLLRKEDGGKFAIETWI